MESTASDQVNAIVNNLSTKIGVAVDKLIPVADTLSNELFVSHLIYGISLSVVALIVLFLAFAIYGRIVKYPNITRDDTAALLSITVLCIGVSVVMFVVSANYISNCFQPTVILLEKINVLN